MACYRPIKAYRSRSGRDPITKKWKLVFNITEGYKDLPMELPCGKCVGCKLDRSKQWATRIMHETSLYKENCYITLTYNDDNIPNDGSIKVEHFQKFIKRLRKKYVPKNPTPEQQIRFFHCGEYGEQLSRPHYHAILFNINFKDRQYYKTSNGYKLDTSETLNKLWPHGFATIGDATWESSSYVARYIMKKINGDKAESHYQKKKPEYITMSRRPGIGRRWYDKYKTDIYNNNKDKIFIRAGVVTKPPRFYDDIYKLEQPARFSRIQIQRRIKSELHQDEDNERRRRVKEKVQQSKSTRLVRKYEEPTS